MQLGGAVETATAAPRTVQDSSDNFSGCLPTETGAESILGVPVRVCPNKRCCSWNVLDQSFQFVAPKNYPRNCDTRADEPTAPTGREVIFVGGDQPTTADETTARNNCRFLLNTVQDIVHLLWSYFLLGETKLCDKERPWVSLCCSFISDQ